MNITSVTYIKDEEGNIDMLDVVIDGKNYGVPPNDSNRHYMAVQEWLAAGNKATNWLHIKPLIKMKDSIVLVSSFFVFTGCIFLTFSNYELADSNRVLARDIDIILQIIDMERQ